MQGNERLHLCLFSVNADVASALRIRSDMVRMQQLYVRIRQPGQGREDESPSCQFHPLVIHRRGKYLLELLTADVPMSCFRLCLILQVLTGIYTENLLIDCKVQQSVQPTQTMVGLGNPEVLAFLQVGFVGLTEILRHFFKRNVLFTDGRKKVRQVLLVVH